MSVDASDLELARGCLRAEGIKLWLEPYWQGERSNEEELRRLCSKFIGQPSAASAMGSDQMMKCLKHLQQHALDKLKLKQQGAVGKDEATPTANIQVAVKVVGEVHNKNVTFPSVHPDTTCGQFVKMLHTQLFGNEEGVVESRSSGASGGPSGSSSGDPGACSGTSRVPGDGSTGITAVASRVSTKLISKGRTLALHDSIGRGAAANKPVSLMAIVQFSAGAATHASQKVGESITAALDSPTSPLNRAKALKDAAKLMAEKRYFENFELSYSDGRQVTLSVAERIPLVTAIVLHSLGKKLLQEMQHQGNSTDSAAQTSSAISETEGNSDCQTDKEPAQPGQNGTASDIHEQSKQSKYAEALTILLEADEEWNKVSTVWKDQVDNYGLLQLDICWAYLWLEHLNSLPDASARIRKAEAVLSKQVNPNFLTIAILNAETGNSMVPPLAAPFVRLLLLKGVITVLHEGKKEEGRALLQQSNSLCTALQVDPEALASLYSLGATEAAAVVALRKHGGNVQNAGASLLEEFEKQRQAKQDKAKQRRFGLTANGLSYVELSMLPQLCQLLVIDEDMAVALLRLSDNDVNKGMEIWHEAGRDSMNILNRMKALEQSLKRSKQASKRKDPPKSEPIDEMALVSIMSLGVERELAETALKSCDQSTGNVIDAAMDWIFNSKQDEVRKMDGGHLSRSDQSVAAGQTKEAPVPDVPSELHEDMEEDAGESSGSSDNDSEGDPKDPAGKAAFLLVEKEVGDALRNSELTEEHLGMMLLLEKEQIEKHLALCS